MFSVNLVFYHVVATIFFSLPLQIWCIRNGFSWHNSFGMWQHFPIKYPQCINVIYRFVMHDLWFRYIYHLHLFFFFDLLYSIYIFPHDAAPLTRTKQHKKFLLNISNLNRWYVKKCLKSFIMLYQTENVIV